MQTQQSSFHTIIGYEVRGGINLSFLFSPDRITLYFYNNPGVITIEKQSLASVILLYLRFIVQGAPGKRGNPGILGEPGEKVRGCYENFCTSIIMIQPRRYSAV